MKWNETMSKRSKWRRRTHTYTINSFPIWKDFIVQCVCPCVSVQCVWWQRNPYQYLTHSINWVFAGGNLPIVCDFYWARTQKPNGRHYRHRSLLFCSHWMYASNWFTHLSVTSLFYSYSSLCLSLCVFALFCVRVCMNIMLME